MVRRESIEARLKELDEIIQGKSGQRNASPAFGAAQPPAPSAAWYRHLLRPIPSAIASKD